MRQKMLLGLLAAMLTCLTTYISSPANAAELIDDRTQYIVPILNGPLQNDLVLLQSQITSAGGTVVGTVGDFNRYFPRALIVRTNPATYQTFLSKVAAFETTLGDPLPDYRYTYQSIETSALVPPKDPFFPSQTHLSAMKVPAAWKLLLQSGVSKIPTKIVGLLDDCRPSAVPNRDLIGRIDVSGFDAERNFSRSFGIGIGGDHAAIMASVIAGSTNTFGTVGVNPGVLIHPVACGQDRFVRESSLMRGVEHCASVGIKLICIGANPGFRFGAVNPNGLTLMQFNKYRNRPESYPIRGLSSQRLVPSLGAFLESYRKYYDGLAFLPSGNDGRSTTSTGDFIKGAVTVGALSADGTKVAPFSNLGSLFAPGQNIYATNASGRVLSVSGTSVAAANATGVASLMSATGLYQQPYVISVLMGNSAQSSPVRCIDALESLRAARDPNISSN